MDCMVQGKRVEIRLRPTLMAAVDEWRRQQPDLPPRAEAVVRLVEMSLEAAAKTKAKAEVEFTNGDGPGVRLRKPKRETK